MFFLVAEVWCQKVEARRLHNLLLLRHIIRHFMDFALNCPDVYSLFLHHHHRQNSAIALTDEIGLFFFVDWSQAWWFPLPERWLQAKVVGLFGGMQGWQEISLYLCLWYLHLRFCVIEETRIVVDWGEIGDQLRWPVHADFLRLLERSRLTCLSWSSWHFPCCWD